MRPPWQLGGAGTTGSHAPGSTPLAAMGTTTTAPAQQPQPSSPTASVVTCHTDAAPEDMSLSSVTLRALGSCIVLKLLLKTGKSTWEPPRETEWGLLCTWARREPLTCSCISGADGCRDPQPCCPQPGGVGMWLVSWYHLIDPAAVRYPFPPWRMRTPPEGG